MKKSLMVVAGAALLGVCSMGCGDAKPCTTCPNVAGNYLAEAPNVPAEKSSCGTLYFNPSSHQIEVIQSGADLKVTDFFGVEGVLYDSLLVDFEQVTVTTAGDAHRQTTMELTGRFYGDEGKREFSGTMHFKVTEDGCTLDVPVTWTQLQADAS